MAVAVNRVCGKTPDIQRTGGVPKVVEHPGRVVERFANVVHGEVIEKLPSNPRNDNGNVDIFIRYLRRGARKGRPVAIVPRRYDFELREDNRLLSLFGLPALFTVRFVLGLGGSDRGRAY